MKPPLFRYLVPETLAEARQMLSAHVGSAKIIAGGQSLIPMMNFRVVQPGVVIDIGRLLELETLTQDSQGGLICGARMRHNAMIESPLAATGWPIIPQALRHVAHLAIRNRGTIGGSLAHADPAAEWALLAVLLEAELTLSSVRGDRRVAANDFFLGPLTTDLQEDEMIIQVRFPALPKGHRAVFQEVSRRPGDFAMAACAVILDIDGQQIRSARVGLMGVMDRAFRLTDLESALRGQRPSDQLIRECSADICGDMDLMNDRQASAQFRRHLARSLVARCLAEASDLHGTSGGQSHAATH